MLQIRNGTFETNSSSTHSIVICTKKQFDEWKSGECRFDPYTDKFVYPDQSKIDEYKREAIEQYKRNNDADPYHIKWNDLTPEAQEKYINNHVKYKQDLEDYEDAYTYDGYRYHYQDGCQYTEIQYTTEHGDVIFAFGKGGYD